MKKILNVLILTLALNFLAVAGVAFWLQSSAHLDKAKIAAIQQILFPPAEANPTTQPTTQPATQPSMKLEALLAKHSGMSASEQVEFIQQSFDASNAELARRERELRDREERLTDAMRQLEAQRAQIQGEQKKLTDQQAAAKRDAEDQGFQDSLRLYGAMPAKQVKAAFMTLEDDAVARYLQAMEPRTAAKILNEYKTDEEKKKMQRVLDRIRQTQATTKE